MLSNIRKFIVMHFIEHISLYFFILLCFSIGIFCGTFVVKALSDIQNDTLKEYLLTSFKTSIVDEKVNFLQVFLSSIMYNAKIFLIIWIFAVSVVLFPLIFFVVGVRGFVLGFTIGFLIQNLGYKGVLISTVSILPQNLIFLPVIIFLTVYSIDYSLTIIRNRKLNKYKNNGNKILTLKYSVGSFIIGIISVIGCLIEGYISPQLLKGISQYFVNFK